MKPLTLSKAIRAVLTLELVRRLVGRPSDGIEVGRQWGRQIDAVASNVDVDPELVLVRAAAEERHVAQRGRVVAYGPDTEQADLAGRTVQEAREAYRHVFSIPDGAIPKVNQKEVSNTYQLQDGDFLNFDKSADKAVAA